VDKVLGLLFIGDPHLASRNPGYRKDDYPRAILDKLEWSLDYAAEHCLMPCLLGDLFHMPRDNGNWLLGELCEILRGREVLAIYGNHDCRENELTEDDSLSILVRAGLLRMVSEREPWQGLVCGHEVIVGGTSYGHGMPTMRTFLEGVGRDKIVFWMAHHDVQATDAVGPTRVQPTEIAGVDVVVNGHIHQPQPDERHGKTWWLTPGNISRVSRSAREHVPCVLRVWIENGRPAWRRVEVPHALYETCFHEAVLEERGEAGESAFVKGLAELQSRRTAMGEGLEEFLDKNLGQFEPPVQREIRKLAEEIRNAT